MEDSHEKESFWRRISRIGFGACNYDPVMLATDLDNPVTAGSKFVYAVSPTIYEAMGSPITVETTKVGRDYSATSGYWYNKMVDGETNYNIIDGKWGKASVDSPKTGDVIVTLLETVTLDDADKTWTKDALATSWTVQKIEYNYYTSARTEDTLAYIQLIQQDAAGVVPARKETWEESVARYEEEAKLAAAQVAVQADALAAAQEDLDDVLAGLSAVDRVAYAAATSDSDRDTILGGPYASNVTTAKANLEAAQTAAAPALQAFAVAPYYEHGARYVITASATVNGVTTTSVTYYGEKTNGNINLDKVVATTSSEDGTAKTFAGTYSISGSYKDGEILITSIDDGETVIEFNDEKDRYTIDDVVYYDRKASYDFPNAYTTEGTTRNGSTYSKKGRTLKIANGVLTSQKIKVVNTASAETDAYFLGAVANTAKRAVDEAESGAGYTGTKLAAQTFTLVQ